MNHASLWIGLAGVRCHSLASVIDDPQVLVLARQPLRTSPVRGQHHVQPDIQTVLLSEVEHAIKIIKLVDPGPGFHPVPVGMAADDTETRRPHSAEIIIPHILARRRSTVVLHANRKTKVRGVYEVGLDIS